MEKKYLIAGAVGLGLVALYVVKRRSASATAAASAAQPTMSAADYAAMMYGTPTSSYTPASSGYTSADLSGATATNAPATPDITSLLSGLVSTDTVSQLAKTLGAAGGTVTVGTGTSAQTATITPTDPNAGAKSFIASEYQNLLGKTPDAAGAAYWLNDIQNGQTFAQVDNSIKTIANQQTVSGIYSSLGLGTPDAGGLQYWTQQLNSGASADTLKQNITNSAATVNAQKTAPASAPAPAASTAK